MISICNLLSGCPNAEVRFAPEQRPDPDHWSCADFRVFALIAAYFKQTNRRTDEQTNGLTDEQNKFDLVFPSSVSLFFRFLQAVYPRLPQRIEGHLCFAFTATGIY